MKNSPFLLLCALLVAAVLLRSWATPERASAQEKHAPASGAKWEYKVIAPATKPEETEKALNQLAAEGWELGWIISRVSGREPLPTGQPPGLGGNKWSIGTEIQLILKRSKS